MEATIIKLKAISDNTRFKIIHLLLKHDYCVRALARHLELSEAAVSQHLKILREAGLITGEKRGYFMHYGVVLEPFISLAAEIEALGTAKPDGRESNRKTCVARQHRCLKRESSSAAFEKTHL